MAVTQRRKLLEAAVGVASVSYVIACGGIGGKTDGGDITSGNLTAPPGCCIQFPEDSDGTRGMGGSDGRGARRTKEVGRASTQRTLRDPSVR